MAAGRSPSLPSAPFPRRRRKARHDDAPPKPVASRKPPPKTMHAKPMPCHPCHIPLSLPYVGVAPAQPSQPKTTLRLPQPEAPQTLPHSPSAKPKRKKKKPTRRRRSHRTLPSPAAHRRPPRRVRRPDHNPIRRSQGILRHNALPQGRWTFMPEKTCSILTEICYASAPRAACPIQLAEPGSCDFWVWFRGGRCGVVDRFSCPSQAGPSRDGRGFVSDVSSLPAIEFNGGVVDRTASIPIQVPRPRVSRVTAPNPVRRRRADVNPLPLPLGARVRERESRPPSRLNRTWLVASLGRSPQQNTGLVWCLWLIDGGRETG